MTGLGYNFGLNCDSFGLIYLFVFQFRVVLIPGYTTRSIASSPYDELSRYSNIKLNAFISAEMSLKKGKNYGLSCDSFGVQFR